MSWIRRISGALLLAAGALLLGATSAGASSVFISFGNFGQFGTTFVTGSQPTGTGTADAVGGSLSVSAYRQDMLGGTSEMEAAIYPIGLTNAGGAPLTFGGSLSPLTLDVTVGMSQTGSSDGSVVQTVRSIFALGLNDSTRPFADPFFQYTQTWSGGAATYSPITFEPRTNLGGTVTVENASYDAIHFISSLPEITLAPGDTVYLYADVDVLATIYGNGHTATTQTSVPARLSLRLPFGAVLTTDAGVPVSWITVPEPALAALVGAALAAMLWARARH